VHGRELLDTAAVLRDPTLKLEFVNWLACEVESPSMALGYVAITAYKNFVYPVRCGELAAAV
jgi:hypothetical protein